MLIYGQSVKVDIVSIENGKFNAEPRTVVGLVVGHTKVNKVDYYIIDFGCRLPEFQQWSSVMLPEMLLTKVKHERKALVS
jgi:hypothetical protein